MAEKPTRGGARKGAGRKPTGRKGVSLTVNISPESKANIEAKAASKGLSASALVDAWAKRLKT